MYHWHKGTECVEPSGACVMIHAAKAEATGTRGGERERLGLIVQLTRDRCPHQREQEHRRDCLRVREEEQSVRQQNAPCSEAGRRASTLREQFSHVQHRRRHQRRGLTT
eukprot:scaffold38047_cov32-Tisochrysis_lutea.AAC.4